MLLPISKNEFLKLSDDEKWNLLSEAYKEFQNRMFEEQEEQECREASKNK